MHASHVLLQVEALIEACKLQGRDLNHITANLPPHLPALQLSQPSTSARAATDNSLNLATTTSSQAAATYRHGAFEQHGTHSCSHAVMNWLPDIGHAMPAGLWMCAGFTCKHSA